MKHLTKALEYTLLALKQLEKANKSIYLDSCIEECHELIMGIETDLSLAEQCANLRTNDNMIKKV